MSVFRCPQCGYAESSAGRRPAHCPDCGRPTRPAPADSSGTNLLIWLGVGALVLVLLAVVGAGVAGYLVFRAARSASAGMVAAVTPPNNPSDALAGLKDPSLFRVELAMAYLKSAPVDPVWQPQIAAELERHLTANDQHAWSAAGGELGDAEAGTALLQAAQRWTRPSVARVQGAQPTADPRALPVFAKGLLDLGTRHDAGEALISIGPAAESEVVPYVSHRDVFVRMEANRIMEAIGTAKSLPALQAARDRFVSTGIPEDRTAATMLDHTIRTIKNRGQ